MGDLERGPCWKQCALLLILLSHAVVGSPVFTINSSLAANSSSFSKFNNSLINTDLTSYSTDAFGPTIETRGRRNKRTLIEALKRAKKEKLLSLGEASSNALKSVGKSILKNVAFLGIKAVIFNFLYSKINQVLDFKNRLLNNLEQKNREQNSQILGIGESASASDKTIVTTSTENPNDQVPDFNPEKISLSLPDAVFGPSFTIVNGASQVIGTLVQNKAERLARLFEALKPFLRSSVGVQSKKRELEDNNGAEVSNSKRMSSTKDAPDGVEEEMPIKTSYTALIQER